GGPMYYIKNGLGRKWMWLAYLYAFFGVCAVFGTGNATQVNTITAAVNTALTNFHVIGAESIVISNWVIGIVICVLVALILIGGLKRIGGVSEKLVPVMSVIYILLGLGLIALRIDRVPAVFAAIFRGAFNPAALTGGVVGSLFVSVQKGVSRGIFSNEAGLGTGSIAHACADTDDPAKQGLYGIFEVFMDTIVICTMTALIVLLSGIDIPYGQAAGAELTIGGFTAVYGNWISVFTAVAMCCFAFSTIVGWGLYGARCAEFLLGSKILLPFNIAYCLVSIVGATTDLGLIWGISDTFNGFMTVPNLIGIFLLTPVVLRLAKDHFRKNDLRK
ncbi:MAG: amino acid carrier protein, partial [Oscillospiraceae bacterium]|nr:amino acid carrier protein [Oscillospiraceae bacterium]